jgi:transcriptional regulator with XRE-family HTH domain
VAIDGEAVRVLRKKAQMGQAELAERLGISVQYLCDIERGRRFLKRNPDTIRRLAEELGVPASMLLRHDDSALAVLDGSAA